LTLARHWRNGCAIPEVCQNFRSRPEPGSPPISALRPWVRLSFGPPPKGCPAALAFAAAPPHLGQTGNKETEDVREPF